jgi:hypothetical protein
MVVWWNVYRRRWAALSILSVPVDRGIGEPVVWDERSLCDVKIIERREVKGSHP